MRPGVRGIGLALASLLAALPVQAQVAAGAIAGVVGDISGAPVPDAWIEAQDRSRALVREARSNAAGRFLLTALPPGQWDLVVRQPGFGILERQGLAVVTGETLVVDLVLRPAGMEEAVVVTANGAAGAQTGLGQTIGEPMVERLPLNGRTFVALAALAPGVALPPGSLLPRINGGRPRTNEYLFDGISVLQPEPGQVPFFPVIDAIQEFRIETNSPPAEFGRFTGGVINLTTRAGSNGLSGRVFEYLRHEALNARNPFAPSGARPTFRRNQFGGVLGGPLKRGRAFFFADYQGQLQRVARTMVSTVPTLLQRQGIFMEPTGGRIPSIYDPASTVVVGGVATRVPFPGGAIPAARLDPVAMRLLDRFPRPTRDGTANNFERAADERVDQQQFGVRVDHHGSARGDRVFARVAGFHERFDPAAPLPEGSGLTTGSLGPQRTQAWTLASAWQRPVSSTKFNELRVGRTSRAVARTAVQLPSGPGADLGLPGIPASGQFPATLPTFQIAGYQLIGSPANTGAEFATRVVQVADTLTWLAGRHTLKFGADLRWSALDIVQPPSPTGLFQFTSLFTDQPGIAGTGSPLASFLLGQVQSFSIDLQQDEIRNRAQAQEYFVQDSWEVSDRVTVNAGLRYTLNFPSVETRNQAAVFDPQARTLEYLGRGGNPRSARRLHWLNVGPRLGITARVARATVVRAGYAGIWIEQAGITTPFTTPAFPFLQTVSERTLDNVSPAFVLAQGPTVVPVPLTPDAGLGQGVFGVDRDLGSGYARQWHAGWQREFTGFVVDVAYVGSRLTRAGVPDANLNQLTVEQLGIGPALLERVANPYFGIIPRSSSLGDPTITRAQLLKPFPEYTIVSLYRNNIGTSNYHGLEARLERRFRRGVSLLASYTWSRLVDDASSVFDASILTGPVANAPVADAFDRGRDRDVSAGDIPHALVVSAVVELPWGEGRRWQPRGLAGALVAGWTVTGIVTAQSGTPVAITQATNFNAFAGFGTQRPNLAGAAALPTDERSTSRWFDTGAFLEAPQFTLGTSTRNPVRGPGWRNLDLALIRNVPVPRAGSIELRIEVFNATNTPALGQPNGVLGSPGFGTITSARDPRVLQLAVRWRF